MKLSELHVAKISSLLALTAQPTQAVKVATTLVVLFWRCITKILDSQSNETGRWLHYE